ncbi:MULTISPECIES: cation diffusion facilitator family transporter [unclassified Agarivorans]|uniref:cation diffusion facilitator family transporter n=1 Tax=unclassified Agarivorans TaxID=2636026 RepID=UPI0026E1A45B|nr:MULTISPECIES: cation diffusion facilitator family transporter [unclassified Agarivorans]MDO6687583.1 cation diffusion facilitator family transporter [Agarivorans sp. 3_MG-2023]MDO6717084.1 cation diffusion facilitator family transporter [Agarivorans sp. 2_MG-2023]
MEKQRYQRLVTLATWVATCVAVALLVIKGAAFLYTGAVSILASLIDSLMDIAMSLVNLLAVRYALQPPDKEHRFGHGKAEHLAGVAQAAFITGSAIMLLFGGFTELLSPKAIEHSRLGITVMIISTLITIGLVIFQRYVIAKTNNSVIKADSMHYAMDIYMNAAVLVALLLSQYGWYWADGLFAVLIAVYICYGAYGIGKESVQNLLDRELPESFQLQVYNCALAIPGVLGAHDIRTRQSGHTKFIQLHLELDDKLILYEAHRIADEVEDAMLAQWPEADVLIHQDPQSVVPQEKKLELE